MTGGRTSQPVADIDPAAIARFVDVVFGYLEGYVPVRVLAETGTPDQKPHTEFPTTENVAEVLIRLAPLAASKSRALYVVPGTVATPGSAKADEIGQTGVVVIDLDNGDINAKRDYLCRNLGPPSMVVASGGRTSDGQEKLHLYWRLTEPAAGPCLEQVRRVREQIAAKVGGDLSFKSLHQPIRAAGTIHGKNGVQAPVRIVEYSGRDHELSELEEALEAMPALAGAPDIEAGIGTGAWRPSAVELSTRLIRANGADGETRFAALSKVIGHWLRNARHGRCTLGDAWEAVDQHNSAMISPPWDEQRLRREFDALLKADLRNHGPMPSAATALATADQPPPLSDDALAAAFVARHGGGWRHVLIWGAWFGWSGTHWVRDETGRVRDLIRLICREAAVAADTPREARRIASDKTIAAVLRIVAADPELATRPSDWDAHPMLLNTPTGVIDLETGEVTSHEAGLLLTQITGASPGSSCPRWTRFIEEITAGDVALQKYLQRLAGYVLTGSTAEQMFAFFHGPGANGKSVFIQTLGAVLGNYAATATLDTFMASSGTRHLTELAGLRAARLVIVPETEAGRTWAEARIKTVTGGEKIRANFMHRDHFEYTPQFKLLVAGNHRPALSNVGEAMRRRLQLVPFEIVIPDRDRDHDLQAKLLDERDGILGWMLAGCAEWLRVGLSAPECVRTAGASYFADEDLFGQWINERCEEGPECRATSKELFASWSAWAEANGHSKGTPKTLGEALRQRGHKPVSKVGRDRGWSGISLRKVRLGGEV